MQTTLEKIQSFTQLKAGWSYGEGAVFAPETLNKAAQLAKTAHTLGFQETDAFPGLNGEVMLTVYQGDEYWEFTLQASETITFVYEKGDETVTYAEGLPYNLLGISDKAARDLLIRQSLADFQVCEGSESRSLTPADFAKGE